MFILNKSSSQFQVSVHFRRLVGPDIQQKGSYLFWTRKSKEVEQLVDDRGALPVYSNNRREEPWASWHHIGKYELKPCVV